MHSPPPVKLLLLACLLIFNGCQNQEPSLQEPPVTPKSTIGPPNTFSILDFPRHQVRFDFTATRLNPSSDTIRIDAFLLNEGADTVLFSTTTCDGEKNALMFDKNKFKRIGIIYCNATYPKLEKIAPGGRLSIDALLMQINRESEIELSYDFRWVDRAFEARCLSAGYIQNGPLELQLILRADKKRIN